MGEQAKFAPIRVFFEKRGNAKYISHLDLYRAMSRAVTRSKLPVWFTEGFNPHIYMTFALPLALGIEGKCESVDLRVLERTDKSNFSEIADSLNSVMPPDLRIIRVATPNRKANEIAKARYLIETDNKIKLDGFLSQPKIEIMKKTKRNSTTIDVSPHLEWESEKSVLTLPAGCEFNINPWNVFAPVYATNVERIAILCKNGEIFS